MGSEPGFDLGAEHALRLLLRLADQLLEDVHRLVHLLQRLPVARLVVLVNEQLSTLSE